MKYPKYSFIKINLPYYIITLVYGFFTWVLLGMSWIALYFVFASYFITFVISLSFVGEYFLRFLMGVRPPMTKKEKDYIIPIFLDVLKSAEHIKLKDFSHHAYLINKKIEIFIDDSMSINAYCFGSRTLVVTRGAINTFSEEQLKGIIAHEYGHIFNGNTYALLFNKLGNGILSLVFLPIGLILRLTEKGIKFIDSDNLRKGKINPTLFILNIIKAIFNTVYIVFNFLSGVILSANSRYCEHLADSLAHLIGYGDELTEDLYLLQQLSFDGNKSINKRLLQSHPLIAKRIEKLELYMEKDKKRQQVQAKQIKMEDELIRELLPERNKDYLNRNREKVDTNKKNSNTIRENLSIDSEDLTEAEMLALMRGTPKIDKDQHE